MKAFFAHLKRNVLHNGNGLEHPPLVDLDAEISRIQQAEAAGVIPTGHLIHQFNYTGFDLRLDQDMTGTYRLTVNEGGHRVYSFTVCCARSDYKALRNAYEEIIGFLSGSRSLAELPGRADLKGHYYGANAADGKG